MSALLILQHLVTWPWICPILPGGRDIVSYWVCFHGSL